METLWVSRRGRVKERGGEGGRASKCASEGVRVKERC